MGSKGRGTKRSLWNSRKAWALVLGGMIAIGVINVVWGLMSVPEGFDENWRWADAGVADAGPQSRTQPAPATPSPAAPTPDAAQSN